MLGPPYNFSRTRSGALNLEKPLLRKETTEMNANLQTDGIEVFGSVTGEFAEILTSEALQFVGRLAREFESRRRELLEARMERQREIDSGKLPDFLPETRE